MVSGGSPMVKAEWLEPADQRTAAVTITEIRVFATLRVLDLPAAEHVRVHMPAVRQQPFKDLRHGCIPYLSASWR